MDIDSDLKPHADLVRARRAGQFSIRMAGTKFDYNRKYTVVDKKTGRVAPQSFGATYEQCDAQAWADRLNGIDPLQYEDEDA